MTNNVVNYRMHPKWPGPQSMLYETFIDSDKNYFSDYGTEWSDQPLGTSSS